MIDKPNVILVITDDQGYGDLGCTGNFWIETPNIDEFYQKAVRLSDFHVSPLCAPTRGALMTGHNPLRNGVWATCWGRSMLKKDEITMADIFADNGYKTGIFGKWHLGDNYPYRPQDRGFQKVVSHKGGGVGQTPDYWGNNYFDDTYFVNGEPEDYEGYCTDIWFEEGLKFIEENKDKPFFCYISTNAPHSPYLVAEEYREPYEDNSDIPEPAFYGMITNIDENFGKLEQKLNELNLKDNTILIFMTDNGSSGGCTLNNDSFVDKGYNAGMRGKKASYYEGGHRVPFFIRWPKKQIQGGKDITQMTAHVDVLPTFIDLCDLEVESSLEFDGTSLAPLLLEEDFVDNDDEQYIEQNKGITFVEKDNKGLAEKKTDLAERKVFVQYRQNTDLPKKWTNAVMKDKWRLINGEELYDIKSDPGQKVDIADQYPEIVKELRESHEDWWEEVYPRLQEYAPISLGNEAENPVCLCAMDVMGDVAWSQAMIVMAQKSTGKWKVEVEKDGLYRISFRRWPEELSLPIDNVIDRETADSIAPYQNVSEIRKIEPETAIVKVGDFKQEKEVKPGEEEVVFKGQLTTGVTDLEAWFIDGNGERCGAYYVYVEYLG